jgi:ubiquinone/menaquinone biosynthesis C-methylase UbiE
MAKMGAKVIGVDISPRLIKMAREEERREPIGIKYYVASFTDLSIFENASFDMVISTMALNASPNFEKAISEFFRVLDSGGELIFSIQHPCFITKGLGWIKDEKGEDSKLTVSHYFDESPQLQEWKFSYAPPDTKPFITPTFYRTLSRILKTLIKTGFVLKDVEEPRPSEEVCKKFPKMKKWRKHAALFFYIRCEKPGLEEEK